MIKERKSRAFNPAYESSSQLILAGFETPFERHLRSDNRWVVLARLIPWYEINSIYASRVTKYHTGRKPLNSRIVVGSLIIKHILNLDDRETVAQISENIYLQYFLGYSSFIAEAPFDASLFVDFRHTLVDDIINEINEKILMLKTKFEEKGKKETVKKDADMQEDKPVSAFESTTVAPEQGDKQDVPPPVEHKGTVIMDATCCPQDIAYPTDLTLLYDAREKAEELIDFLYDKEKHGEIKPRTYRKEARKTYLHTAQKKNKSKKEVRKAVGKQLRYLRRDISIIHSLLDEYRRLPFNRHQLRYFYVIQTLYDQQIEMYEKHTHTVEHRIVSMHQPHVRPIVRGKAQAKVEFGAKIHATMIDGITFLDEISWDAFNEGSHLETYVEQYYERYKFYPRLLLADQIYCTRVNRLMLKAKGIALRAKPLGRPSLSAALSNHVSPGERNPIEGKFGQGKTAYGMNRIKARLIDTSQSWIASIVLVLNLVKLAGVALVHIIVRIINSLTAMITRYISTAIEYSETRTLPDENMGWIPITSGGV